MIRSSNCPSIGAEYVLALDIIMSRDVSLAMCSPAWRVWLGGGAKIKV